jgi:DNA-binding LacI/PurR family transcriptional regulator
VTGQNQCGGGTIGSFLVAGGHTRFAYVAGLEDSSTSRDREQGFREALAQAGASLSQRVVGHYNFSAAQQAARALFAKRQRPDAVFCANDHTAFAVMETARAEFGLDVGREVSIVGFDDVGLASWPAFSLTTFSQPIRPMVQRVVEVTLGRIEGDDDGPVHDVVPGELVVRTSARLPPKHWTDKQ